MYDSSDVVLKIGFFFVSNALHERNKYHLSILNLCKIHVKLCDCLTIRIRYSYRELFFICANVYLK